MPIDSIKTNYQVTGEVNTLYKNVKKNGIRQLFNGSSAAFSTCLMGHYPWFFTYNYLNTIIKETNTDSSLIKLIKRGSIGLSSSIVSDTFSNSFKIIKTIKQTNNINTSYYDIIKYMNNKDGYKWIFRGLKTKYIVNGINSIIFSITWKYFQNLNN